MRLARTILLATMLLAAAGAQAGVLHPMLEQQMAETPPDQPLTVIVHMSEQAPIAQMNENLKLQRATLAKRHRDVVLALQDAARSQEDLQRELDERVIAGGVLGYTSHWISNLIVVRAQQQDILDIAARSDVLQIEPNFQVEFIEPVGNPGLSGGEIGNRGIGVPPGQRAIRAPEVWYELGINGTGRLIGSMDTGVDGNHPALASRWRGLSHPWQECWLDVLGGGTSFPSDSHSHGTHTTGTMTGVAYDDTIGVAWGAEWIACNAINQGVGTEFDNDVIDAFEWFADPDGDPYTTDDVPDVVQNSWRVYDGLGYPDCYTLWYEVIDNCEAAGCCLTWSAGNEGPNAYTIGSPPDRAETTTNAFSIGAVNATNYDWPYPIAGFSSRGPSDCPSSPETEIKPEVVAPGVEVYSSVPGGGYQQTGWNGTSMAGPHVAGIVALMRQANPDLDVDTIKTILMETARDEGTAGEDNTFGHGFIDAYEAVIAAMSGFGAIEGYVTNASWGDAPLPGAVIHMQGTGYYYWTDETGFYSGLAPAADYTVHASVPGFAAQVQPLTVNADETALLDFSLTDVAGPSIRNVSQPGATTDTAGPYVVTADVNDFSTVVYVKLFYRFTETSDWIEVAMSERRGTYEASIPGAPIHTRVDYYLEAEDGLGHTSVSPSPFEPPEGFYRLYITEQLYGYEAEDPGDPYWTLGAPGDDATSGLWERADPVGTEWSGIPVQPEDDHTPDPGVKCFVTGNGAIGGSAGDNDVDGGCTTLTSPVFDLSEPDFAFVKYWRWFGQTGNATDDEFAVDISGDGGSTWTALERVPGNENSWLQITADIGALLDGLTDQVTFRFIACDEGNGGLVEAAIDDFALEVFMSEPTDVSDWEPQASTGVTLLQSRPNPFHPGTAETTIQFALEQESKAKLQVFDISGRLVKTLAEGSFEQGVHTVLWNGRDERGHTLSSGVYFYRLKAGERILNRRLVILR